MARTSAWLMSLTIQMGIATYVLHRFDWMSTGLALPLFGVVVLVSGVAAVLSLLSLRHIWRTGDAGAAPAAAGMVLSFLILGATAGFAGYASRYAPISDVTTDLEQPPNFDILATRRPPGANPVSYDASRFADRQRAHYPDLGPLDTRRSASEAYDAVLSVAKKLGWQIVAAGAPGEGGPNGEVEAVEQTMIMGFRDDIAVRIRPLGEMGARIDVRSASRFGVNDLGRNAQRIRDFLAELKRTIESGQLTTTG